MPLPTPIKRRLNELELRSRLRARPRLQGRILAPAGLLRRPPGAGHRSGRQSGRQSGHDGRGPTPSIYFPFYHEVLPEYADGLRRHLLSFRRTGPLVSWDEALAVLDGRWLPDGPVFCLSFDDGHRSWRDVVLPLLRDLDVPATFFLTTGLVGRPGALSWPDCREIVAAGYRFGSHTVTHPRLSDADGDAAAGEILDSKKKIEDELGLEVADFAAPYGNPAVDYLDRDVRTAREAGFRSFASTLRDPMHPGDSPMAIHRQGLHPAWPAGAVRTRVHA